MTLSKTLAAAALALPFVLTGCKATPEQVAQSKQTLEQYGIKKIDFPYRLLQNSDPGAYEVPVQTSYGKKVCIASVNGATHVPIGGDHAGDKDFYTRVTLNCP